ncbi:MAG: hypothetical protein VR65_07955 [Desulfobulbaceae bacterium BRH_c16a]|nr:MAG: hypothetical protein VR65_07955 [Desulfobulbaceae bacterium BRH_c16a]
MLIARLFSYQGNNQVFSIYEMKYFIRSPLFLFWGRFLKPYLPFLIPLIFLNMVPGFLLSIRPLVLAPVLGKVLPSDIGPANSIKDLTLDNLGATIQSIIVGPSNTLMSAFMISGLLYLLLTLSISLISGSVTLWSLSIRLRILKDMIIALQVHLLGLHLAYFIKEKTGSLISRFTNDLTKTSGSLEIIFSGLMKSSIQLLVYTLILLRSDAILTFQVLLVGSIHIVISRGLGKRVKRLTTVAYDGLASLVASLQETFQNIRIIKSFVAEDFDTRKITNESEKVRKNHFDFMFARYLEEPIRLFADAVVTAAILYISYQAISENRMTMAGIALFFYMASQLVTPVAEISRHVLSIYSVQGGFQKIVEMFDTKSELIDGDQAIETFKDQIVLERVSFRFGDPLVLNNINLVIKKGETIGIVGGSGGGKSTLIDLILRLNDPTEGKITFDGVNIKKYTQASYRKCFGIVSQECLLFNATIQENILLGRPLVEEDLLRASKIANLEEFIRELPEKFATKVGDRGIMLSGGQRQRIAIARAVYAHPEILVLDEATSALDTISERKVQKAITKAIKGVTAIIVAHRLSTIVHADKIVVLKDGAIEAVGSHEELLQNSISYYELSQHQLI